MDTAMINTMNQMGEKARQASRILSGLSSTVKDQALLAMADNLVKHSAAIIAANQIDLTEGEKMGLTKALLERLTLSEARITAMADGLREIAALPDPIGEMTSMIKRPNGLEICKVRVPIGVVAIIYESRPNVTADAAGLCLKSGNAIILRGGEEAINSVRIITGVLSEAAASCGIPEGAIQMVDSIDKEAAVYLMKMNDYLDMLIPRGGIGLKKAVMANASVPYIMTGMGNCHVYVDDLADMQKALPIVINAKVQRPSVCNAAETLLIAQSIAAEFVPLVLPALQASGVEIRACEKTRTIYSENVVAATDEDWAEEYLDLIMAVKIVDGVEEAIEHINRYGTGHSEAIVTESYGNARRFMQAVDAAAVYTNASTRFTDGQVFGLGGEMGISTQKLHARGPMGIRELTSSKYLIWGEGQIR